MQTNNNISITTKVCKLFQLIADMLISLKLVVRERKRKRPQLGILKVKFLKKIDKEAFFFHNNMIKFCVFMKLLIPNYFNRDALV